MNDFNDFDVLADLPSDLPHGAMFAEKALLKQMIFDGVNEQKTPAPARRKSSKSKAQDVKVEATAVEQGEEALPQEPKSPAKCFRSSGVYKLIGKGKNEILTQTAMSAIDDIVLEDLFGFSSFKGTKETDKGNLLEDHAIELTGEVYNKFYLKHNGRVSNGLITGECDILTDNYIRDMKCAWSIGSHPFWQDVAQKKAKDSGYLTQMQCYMWLYERDTAYIDFWLLPTPYDLLGYYDDEIDHIDRVCAIPLEKRVTTVEVKRDEAVIDTIKEMIPHCQAYYERRVDEYMRKGTVGLYGVQ